MIYLTEDRQTFLRKALADLPTMAAECVERRHATLTDAEVAGR